MVSIVYTCMKKHLSFLHDSSFLQNTCTCKLIATLKMKTIYCLAKVQMLHFVLATVCNVPDDG